MKVCDICKNPSAYEKWVVTNAGGGSRKMDLCGKCYSLLCDKLCKHTFFAYQEVVEEVTNKPIGSVKKTWVQRLKFRGDKNET